MCWPGSELSRLTDDFHTMLNMHLDSGQWVPTRHSFSSKTGARIRIHSLGALPLPGQRTSRPEADNQWTGNPPGAPGTPGATGAYPPSPGSIAVRKSNRAARLAAAQFGPPAYYSHHPLSRPLTGQQFTPLTSRRRVISNRTRAVILASFFFFSYLRIYSPLFLSFFGPMFSPVLLQCWDEIA